MTCATCGHANPAGSSFCLDTELHRLRAEILLDTDGTDASRREPPQ